MLVALDTKATINAHGGIVIGPFPRIPAALEAVRVEEIDGAILDINIAGSPSFAVADALTTRDIPFVFCTGYGRDSIPARFRGVPLIEKPIIRQELIDRLAEVVAARDKTRQTLPG